MLQVTVHHVDVHHIAAIKIIKTATKPFKLIKMQLNLNYLKIQLFQALSMHSTNKNMSTS